MTRLDAIRQALGNPTATEDEIAESTGCQVNDLIHRSFDINRSLGSDYTHGWMAARTCSLDWNMKVNFPKNKGNLAFWIGAAEGLICK